MSTVSPPRGADKPHNAVGAVFVTLCCALLAAGTLSARALGPEIAGDDALHTVQITWVRYTIGALITLPIALVWGVRFRGAAWRLHAGRVSMAVAGMTALFGAAGLMPLADATAISFLAPLFTMLFAVVFLAERVGVWRWGAALIAFSGALVITQPGTDAFQPAALVALAAAAFMGAEIAFIRVLSLRERPMQVLTIVNVGGAAIMTVPVFFFWQSPSMDQWVLMGFLGVVMICSQACLLRGIAILEANLAAPIFYSTLIFAALYAWLVFAEVPTMTTAAGAALIIGGSLVVTWRENLARRRKTSKPSDSV